MGGWQSSLEGLEMNPSFWHGRRVFLTGHTGFKGSWLSLWLEQLGASVTGFSLEPPTSTNLFDLARVADGMRSIYGDVCNLAKLSTALAEARPEIVIHMAAQSLVRQSYAQPVETYATNVMGTVHLLEAVRHTSGIKSVVIVTTDKCYENQEWAWGYRENEPMGGRDPYSNSKGCTELVSAAYRASFFNAADYSNHGVAIATARAGNVIGGGDWAKDRLIPDILAAFEKDQPAVIRNPQATRPWQHVLEPLRGYLTLAERLHDDGMAFAEGWNFGPSAEDAKPVEWIATRLAQKWSAAASWELTGGTHPHEAHYLKLDISKAAHRLPWKPRINLEQGLDLIVDWALQKKQGADMRSITLAQIQTYEAQILAHSST